MKGDVAITAEHLTKAYRLWHKPVARLKTPIFRALGATLPNGSSLARRASQAATAGYRDITAVHPISFAISRGEAVGIIGRNGSGKSTLLQLIAGILQPSAGRIATRGRISALLELGSGFNPEFTGRENVYLNGSILGLTAREMDSRFEQIEAFADIGEFINEPVKTYSSGMMMRLAFSVAVSVQPDILIVDEALSVGDVFFTQKCFERIREILAGGATLVFVSHDTAAIQNLCTRGLLLHRGQLAFEGPPEECVARYFSLHSGSNSAQAIAGTHATVKDSTRAAVVSANVIPQARSRHGDRDLEIVAASVTDAQSNPAAEFEMMQVAHVRVLLRANKPILRPSIGLQLHDRMSNLVFAAGTAQLGFAVPALHSGQEILLDFRLTFAVQPGAYTMSLDAAQYDADNPNIGTFFDRVGGIGPITIGYRGTGTLPFYGIARLPMEIGYA